MHPPPYIVSKERRIKMKTHFFRLYLAAFFIFPLFFTTNRPVTAGWEWQNPLPQGNNYLEGVWGSSGTDVFAVGWAGTILHYDGTTWSSTKSGTTAKLVGIWGSSATDVFAVGYDYDNNNSGIILHYDGNSWSAMESGLTENLKGVWGSSATDVFAVGYGNNNSGIIFHYDGNAWSAMDSGLTENLKGIWGSSATDVFAVGSFGVILHYNGTLSTTTTTTTAFPITTTTTTTTDPWNIETVHRRGFVGGHTSIALDSSDRVHISYLDDKNYDLKYVTGISSSWNTPETVDSSGTVSGYTSIVLDSSDKVHISYTANCTNYDLKYVTGTSGSWNTPERLDSSGAVGRYPSIALDSSDKVHISYFDNTNYDLKYATQQTKPTTTTGIDFVTLLPGQCAEFLTNQITSFGSHSIVVMSLGNEKLTGKLTPVTEEINGLGWISLLGTGTGGDWFDLSSGFFPLDGIDVEIDLNQWLNFAIATGSVIATLPVSAENPIEYKIKVTGTATE